MIRKKTVIKNIILALFLAGIEVLILCGVFHTISVKALDDNEKVIYLTFDDGPSNIVTNRVLTILEDKGIKGTFFVVGEKIKDREEILKRIHKEGHTIGLHSYTHIMKKVYLNEEAFINEMDMTAEEVKRVLGINTYALRFPGGSKKRLNEDLYNKLHEKGYKIFDWNACLSDGISYKIPPERLYKDAVKVVGKSPSRVILLLHCDQPNINTVTVLPKIIDYYKSQGYVFRAIDENTPELYFKFKKVNILWRVFHWND